MTDEQFLQIRDDIRQVQTSSTERMAALSERMAALEAATTERIVRLEASTVERMSALEGRISGLEGKIVGLDGRLDGLEVKIDTKVSHGDVFRTVCLVNGGFLAIAGLGGVISRTFSIV